MQAGGFLPESEIKHELNESVQAEDKAWVASGLQEEN